MGFFNKTVEDVKENYMGGNRFGDPDDPYAYYEIDADWAAEKGINYNQDTGKYVDASGREYKWEQLRVAHYSKNDSGAYERDDDDSDGVDYNKTWGTGRSRALQNNPVANAKAASAPPILFWPSPTYNVNNDPAYNDIPQTAGNGKISKQSIVKTVKNIPEIQQAIAQGRAVRLVANYTVAGKVVQWVKNIAGSIADGIDNVLDIVFNGTLNPDGTIVTGKTATLKTQHYQMTLSQAPATPGNSTPASTPSASSSSPGTSSSTPSGPGGPPEGTAGGTGSPSGADGVIPWGGPVLGPQKFDPYGQGEAPYQGPTYIASLVDTSAVITPEGIIKGVLPKPATKRLSKSVVEANTPGLYWEPTDDKSSGGLFSRRNLHSPFNKNRYFVDPSPDPHLSTLFLNKNEAEQFFSQKLAITAEDQKVQIAYMVKENQYILALFKYFNQSGDSSTLARRLDPETNKWISVDPDEVNYVKSFLLLDFEYENGGSVIRWMFEPDPRIRSKMELLKIEIPKPREIKIPTPSLRPVFKLTIKQTYPDINIPYALPIKFQNKSAIIDMDDEDNQIWLNFIVNSLKIDRKLGLVITVNTGFKRGYKGLGFIDEFGHEMPPTTITPYKQNDIMELIKARFRALRNFLKDKGIYPNQIIEDNSDKDDRYKNMMSANFKFIVL